MEIKKHYVAGREMIRYNAEGIFFNRSPFLEECLSRYPVEGYVGDTGLPVVRVKNGPLANVPIFGQADGRLIPTGRAPGVAATAVGVDTTSLQVVLQSRALAMWLPVEYELSDDGAWNLRESGTLDLQRHLLLDKDRRLAAVVNSPSNTGSAFLPNSAWNATGDAVRHVEHLISYVSSAGGLRPDRLIFGTTAWAMFCSNSAALARVGGFCTPSRVSELFRVGTTAVADVRANVGFGVERRYSPIFPGDAVLAFRAGNPGQFEARWGCTPSWRPGGYDSTGRFLVEMHPYSRRNQSTRLEVGTWENEIVVDPQLGAILRGCGSAQSGGI